MPRRKTSEPPGTLIDVAVMAAIRRTLTYRVPSALDVRVGQRVKVPLGTRSAIGIALEPVARPAPGLKVRDVAGVLDPEPVLSPELVTLGLWVTDYYLAPPGEVFRAMLPLRSETRRARLVELTEAGKRKLEELKVSLLGEMRAGPEVEFLNYLDRKPRAPIEPLRKKFGDLLARAEAEGWVAVSREERPRGRRSVFGVRPVLLSPSAGAAPKLSPVARRILEALERDGPVDDHRELLRSARGSLAALRNLGQLGLVDLSEPSGSGLERGGEGPWPELTPAQAAILDSLTEPLEEREYATALVHGVTASGKTEIYLRLIARCLERGRRALMLVPEIALTPAVEAQFAARFGVQAAVLHSGLSANDRHEAWWRARRGEARVVLGTRSAVFAPLADLGLVIVDEEHDPGYKQGETPRYHARDVAVVRGRLARALVVLGSATPSLESTWNARQGKYRLAKLEERIGGRPLAPVEIVDMRREFRETHTQVPISRRLKEEIEAQLRRGAQTIILLNRRGYSWFVLCRSCGETERCRNCSISLTYHRREHRLVCHYCAFTAPIPARCAACGSEYLYYVGEGTEKLELRLAELFPGARVVRLDRDVAQRAAHFRKVLGDFRQGKIDILVGTQLISKGHDFPGVTLVGVVSADQGLALPDFRAAERTFQILTQAAGRAGRGENPGRVLVQTFYPEHYAIRLAAEQNYEGFFVKEMKFRRLMHYPPATALANIIAQHRKLEEAARIAKLMGQILPSADDAAEGLRVLGPSPAPLARIEGRYRIQFLIKSTSRARLHQVLSRLAEECEHRGIPPQSVMIDVDPVSVL